MRENSNNKVSVCLFVCLFVQFVCSVLQCYLFVLVWLIPTQENAAGAVAVIHI